VAIDYNLANYMGHTICNIIQLLTDTILPIISISTVSEISQAYGILFMEYQLWNIDYGVSTVTNPMKWNICYL